MTGTDNPTNTGNPDGASSNSAAYATTASVTGLAREIEALRRDLGELRALPDRVTELAALVAQLAEATTASIGTQLGVTSWLDLPTDPSETALAVLTELITWMQVVYLRYPDAGAGLPECWLWHPHVVEELLWLMHAWLAAYHDDNAPVSLAGDWHDRLRPGVVRRITSSTGRCSLEAHQSRDDHPTPGAPPVVPLVEAVESIADWWATHRSDPPPPPTLQQLADADQHQAGKRR